LAKLPEPYQTAFRQGSAHHLPGQFLPAQIDWFREFFTLPFMLMYGAPALFLLPTLVNQAIRRPGSYGEFWQKVVQGSLPQTGVILLLLLIIVVMLGYCTAQAWDLAQSFYRTWQMHRMGRRREHGYGLVLLPHGIVGRLVDNFGWQHNCLWLPRTAIADITWQQMREEGAKRTRWVYRTRLCYVTSAGKHTWLTLKGNIVQLDPADGAQARDHDRALYNTLMSWWKEV
jgi:hypothetical protein